MRLLQPFDDGNGLGQHLIALHQRRHQPLRIDRKVTRLGLPALDQIDLHPPEIDALEIERDAHAKGRERAPEREQLHGPSPLRKL